jgi:hypothetical protein
VRAEIPVAAPMARAVIPVRRTSKACCSFLELNISSPLIARLVRNEDIDTRTKTLIADTLPTQPGGMT